MRKTVGIIILLVYTAVVGLFACAEYFYQTGKAQGNLEELKMAAVCKSVCFRLQGGNI